MIEEQTVFILGAGASKPYGLPIAKELRTQICFNFADRIRMLIESRSPSKVEEMYQEALEFTEAFYGSSDSIDLWLMKNTRFHPLGKHAIITYILQGEHDGDFREKAPNPDQDWYSYIWKRMTDVITKQEDYKRFSENKVDFITFNYDRSLEQFLFESLGYGFYDISEGQLIEELEKRRIIHVYGQIAPLDWKVKFESLSYGAKPDNLWLSKYNNNIKIIREAENTKEVEDAISLIEKARRIFFLGFGYAKENLDLLKLPQVLKKGVKVYGTAYGLTPNEILKIKNNFRPILDTDLKYIHIEDMDSLMLLRQFL